MRFCHGAMKSVIHTNETPVSDLKADFAPLIRTSLSKAKNQRHRSFGYTAAFLSFGLDFTEKRQPAGCRLNYAMKPFLCQLAVVLNCETSSFKVTASAESSSLAAALCSAVAVVL